jgi:hypothetical protein
MLRLVLGQLQMIGAVASFVLLAATGLGAATLVAAASTTMLTLTSRWLFRRR